MAKKVGVHYTSIFYYCNGKRNPGIKIIKKIEKITKGRVKEKDLK